LNDQYVKPAQRGAMSLIYMDNFIGPKEINNTCRQITYIETTDRGFTVIQCPGIPVVEITPINPCKLHK